MLRAREMRGHAHVLASDPLLDRVVDLVLEALNHLVFVRLHVIGL